MWDQWQAPEGSGFPETSYTCTDNGWMQSDVFAKYFERVFLKQIGDERPILLIFDGHTTHLSLNVLELAKKEQVEIIKLPPHSSHLLQPLDLSVFKPLKTYWDQALVKWQRQHIGKKLPKSEFSKIVGKLWLETKIEIICNGFKKGGIYPFNDKIIPNEKYDPILLQKWQSLNLSKHADNGSNQQNQTLPEPTTSISISHRVVKTDMPIVCKIVRINISLYAA